MIYGGYIKKLFESAYAIIPGKELCIVHNPSINPGPISKGQPFCFPQSQSIDRYFRKGFLRIHFPLSSPTFLVNGLDFEKKCMKVIFRVSSCS